MRIQNLGLAALAATALVIACGVTPGQAAPVGSAAGQASSTGTATLRIAITDLPAKVAASVLVTGPNGFHKGVTSSTTIKDLATGTYKVSAKPVKVPGGSTDYPAVTGASQTLAAGKSATSKVAYDTQIPSTTKPVTAADITSVTQGTGGISTVVVQGAAPIAAGDIVAAGTGPATPDGLLAKVTAVTVAGTTQTLTTTPATLRQAIPEGEFSIGAADSSALARQTRAVSAIGVSGTHHFACGKSGTLTVTPKITADPPAPILDAAWTRTGVDLTVGATEQMSATLTATATAKATCTLKPTAIGKLIRLRPISKKIGDVLLVIVPEVRFFVRGTASATAQVTASVTQNITATAGLRYAGGHLTPIHSVTGPRSYQSPTVSRTAQVSLSVGPDVTLAVYGLLGPTVNIDPGTELDVTPSTNPWWKLYATLTAGMSLDVPELGVDVADTAIINDKWLLASAVGPRGTSPTGTELPTTGFGLGLTNIPTSPLITGPDGRLWMMASDPNTSANILEAINPSTHAITTYRVPQKTGTDPIYYDGPLAFDGSGQVWMGAEDSNTDSTFLVRHSISTGKSSIVPMPARCFGDGDNGVIYPLYSATNGYVWTTCLNSTTGFQWVVRITPSGSVTSYQNKTGGGMSPWLAPGPGGSMWTVVGGESGPILTSLGIASIAPSGQIHLYDDDPSISKLDLDVAGNGKSVVDIAACTKNGQTQGCYFSVSPSGAQTQLAEVPLAEVSGAYTPYPASMDGRGNVWLLDDNTDSGAAPSGQYYFEVTPSGGSAIDSFRLPAPNASSLLVPTGAPVGTSGGAIWAEEGQPDLGYLFRVAGP